MSVDITSWIYNQHRCGQCRGNTVGNSSPKGIFPFGRRSCINLAKLWETKKKSCPGHIGWNVFLLCKSSLWQCPWFLCWLSEISYCVPTTSTSETDIMNVTLPNTARRCLPSPYFSHIPPVVRFSLAFLSCSLCFLLRLMSTSPRLTHTNTRVTVQNIFPAIKKCFHTVSSVSSGMRRRDFRYETWGF